MPALLLTASDPVEDAVGEGRVEGVARSVTLMVLGVGVIAGGMWLIGVSSTMGLEGRGIEAAAADSVD